jgi:enoyl-CoA hydratase
MNSDGPVLVITEEGPVRVVTMNRPDRMNAVNEELHSELTYVWGKLTADRGARSVILTGAGNAFSAGGDADFLLEVNGDSDVRWRTMDEARRLVTELARFPLPLIAAVNGPAVGLGSSLASLCDLVLMSDRAYFADPHVPLGLAAADGAVASWPFIMGAPRAKYHLFTGEKITAAMALEMGLANRVLPPEELLPAATALAQRLAELPGSALRATKRAVNLHLERHAHAVMDFATTAEEAHFTDPRLRAMFEGMAQR